MTEQFDWEENVARNIADAEFSMETASEMCGAKTARQQKANEVWSARTWSFGPQRRRWVCSTWLRSGGTSWKNSSTQLFREWWRKFLKSWSSFHSHRSRYRIVWWNRTRHAAVPQIQKQNVDDMKVIHPSKALATAHSGEERGCAHVSEFTGNFGSCANNSTKVCFEANWRRREIHVDLKCWWQTRWDRWEEKEILDLEGHGHAPCTWVERAQQSSVWGWTCEKRWPQDWSSFQAIDWFLSRLGASTFGHSTLQEKNMKAQTFQNKKKEVEMMVLVDMRIVREQFMSVGQMTLKRTKKENDNAGHGSDEYSESTFASEIWSARFELKMAGGCSPESQGRKRSKYEVAERCRSWRRWTTPRKHTKYVTLSDMVKDIMRRIPINKRGREDSLCVTLEGKALKLSDDVKGCGVRDGSTLHVIIEFAEQETTRARSPTSRAR